MGLGSPIKPIVKGLTTLITICYLSAQETPLSEIFFLDLGIVIEPANNSETYSRLVEKAFKRSILQNKKSRKVALSIWLPAKSYFQHWNG
jgi:hypothetical protein